MTNCNATIIDPVDKTTYIECSRDAGHYNPATSDHGRGHLRWNDIAEGATPHRDATAPLTPVFDVYEAGVSFHREGDPENAAKATATGSAAFVAAVMNWAAEAFKEDGQR